ncbi:MAG: hypothetical protein CFE26_11880 [Verrucomicrobiales bacterium VVV1]|nr:MAG: hypothetical protein CFE26_11880 [Verrucomicrobiales bacterium VVV1]
MINRKIIFMVILTALCNCKKESPESPGVVKITTQEDKDANLSGEGAANIIPTKNKFSKELADSVQSNLTFVYQKESIKIRTKLNAALPLEFVEGKRLEPSDGVLSLGGSFAWPGCGFDRTSYMVREITQQSVTIEYHRGNPKQDGYQDSGEFKINIENDQEAE